MIRGKFFGCFVFIFFLSYSIILFQSGFAQNTQLTTTQAPSVEAPPFIIARATSPSWTQVNFQVNATSATSDKISVYCNPASGSAFPMGSTIVLCAAKDPATSLVGYAMFNVTVKDTSPPTFKVPHSILKQADDLQGANITYDANASDTVDGNTVTTCDPPSGSTFPLGLNQVKCTATDKSGNKAEASFSVIIGQTSSDESTEEAIPVLSQNETNQLKSPESTVSKNITDDSIPETVSKNITDDSIPETVSENITDDSIPETVSENITDDSIPETVSKNITDDSIPETVSKNITVSETVSKNITDDSIPETVSKNITDDSIPETVSENITDDSIPETVSENITDDSIPETVSENITDDSIPETVSENITDDSIPETVSENITDDSIPETVSKNITDDSIPETVSKNITDDSIPETVSSIQKHYRRFYP